MLVKAKKPSTYQEHAYLQIKSAIINHEILPGTILSERELSENLGISRTPLGRAIEKLKMEGWVRTVPRKGVFVNHISLVDVNEVLQLRTAIEVLAAELAYVRITEHEIQQLEDIHMQQSKNSQDKKKFIAIDKDFHMYIAELSSNSRLIQLMRTLNDQMKWFGMSALSVEGRIEGTLKEHSQIIKSFKERRIDDIKKAVLKHIENTRFTLLSTLHLKGDHIDEKVRDNY